MVVLGRISGPFGVRGWIKVQSYTDPPAGILDYDAMQMGRAGHWRPVQLLEGRPHGKGVVARLEGVADREEAARLAGLELAVRREALAEPAPGEYYWTDLEGLRVVDLRGRDLGRVARLLDTGAHAVLVVQGRRERLIPFVGGRYVRHVDLGAGVIQVDWHPDD